MEWIAEITAGLWKGKGETQLILLDLIKAFGEVDRTLLFAATLQGRLPAGLMKKMRVGRGGRNAGGFHGSLPSAFSLIICVAQTVCYYNTKLGDEEKGRARKGASRSEKPGDFWALKGNADDGR